ncbi:hypothetical protein FRX31_021266, partial [Thalictrum thalictroides]
SASSEGVVNAAPTDIGHVGSSSVPTGDSSSRKRKVPEPEVQVGVSSARENEDVGGDNAGQPPVDKDINRDEPTDAPPSPFAVPIFSPSFIVDDRRVTIEDSAWNDPPIAYMMTQHTTLPNDRKVMKNMSDQDLKAHLICLTAQIKD